MSPADDPAIEDTAAGEVLAVVDRVFESLGRGLICLDHRFRILHVSPGIDQVAGEGAAAALLGRDIAAAFGEDLFGRRGSMRAALERGERREGWGATLQVDSLRPRLLSITAAPIRDLDPRICDPRVAFVVVLRQAEESDTAGRATPTIFCGLVARSTAMLKIFKLIENLEGSDATVLIGGESGTGKELVARAVHVHSPRRKGPFVAVNCGALPGELLESELFGHVRGAFTGAVRDRVGRFELAQGGTLFLDEVGDLPLRLQVKLLRVLQERTFERVGESPSRTSDARVIAATHYDLRRQVHAGEFRDDLYYRLRVVPIDVPPLRERREDIEPLARHLLTRVGQRHDRSLRLAPAAMRSLLRHHWPGNVRELENALEYAVAICRGQTIHPGDLPLEVQAGESQPTAAAGGAPARPGGTPSAAFPAPTPGTEGPESRPDDERIRGALDAHQWRRVETAHALGISRTTLWRKMRELGLL